MARHSAPAVAASHAAKRHWVARPATGASHAGVARPAGDEAASTKNHTAPIASASAHMAGSEVRRGCGTSRARLVEIMAAGSGHGVARVLLHDACPHERVVPTCAWRLGADDAVGETPPAFRDVEHRSLDRSRRGANEFDPVLRAIHAVQPHVLVLRSCATLYDMVHPNTASNVPVRTLFVIDPEHRVRLTSTYPPTTGRNFSEVLRAIDSLKLTSEHEVATPANWERGDDVIILPSVSDEDAGRRYHCGWRVENSSLRYVKDPTLR